MLGLVVSVEYGCAGWFYVNLSQAIKSLERRKPQLRKRLRKTRLHASQ